MKIDLLPSDKLIGTTGVDDLARSAVVRVIANIFDKQVRVGTDVPFHDKRRFGDRIALLTRKLELCEHATEAPTASDLPRPRKLDIRFVPMTGDAARPGGEAQACCRGENNPAGERSKLHLDSGSDVRKPGRVSTVNRTEIVE